MDPDASTVDQEGQLLNPPGRHGCRGLCAPRPLCGRGAGAPHASGSPQACTATTEGNEADGLPSGSRSPSSSRWKCPVFPSGSSEAGSPWAYLNSSGSSLTSLAGRTRQEAPEARTLQPDDLQRLLAGVTHAWLSQRLASTGEFQPSQLHGAYGKYHDLAGGPWRHLPAGPSGGL